MAPVVMAMMAATKISAAGMASARISLRYFGSSNFIGLTSFLYPHAYIHMANSRSSVPSAF